MNMTRRMIRWTAAVIALAAACACNQATGNHYILPCGHKCDTAGVNRWIAIGPEGDVVDTLTIDPVTPTTVYATTATAGVRKSVDGGVNWAPANGGLPAPYVPVLAIDPSTPSNLYAGTNAGIFKSTDGGQSWAAANGGLDVGGWFAVHALAIDPGSPSTLYAGTTNGMFKSIDGAATWASIPAFDTWQSGPSTIAIDPASPSTVYIGTSACDDEGCLYAVLKSRDAGTTWVTIHRTGGWWDSWDGFGPPMGSIAIDPRSPSRLYLAVAIRDTTSLYVQAPSLDRTEFAVSDDGGATWTDVTAPAADVSSLVIDAAVPATIYATTHSGTLYRSTDSAATWAPVGSAPGEPWDREAIHLYAIAAATPAMRYAVADTGIFHSADGGQRWERSTLGLRRLGVGAMAVDPSVPSTIYADVNGVVMKTTDGGGHWDPAGPRLSRREVSPLMVDPGSPGTVYARFTGTAGASTAPLYKSIDAGATWGAAASGLTSSYLQVLAIAPALPSTLYAGANHNGVLKTTDGGASWSRFNEGLSATGSYVSALAVDPTAADTVYVATPPDRQPYPDAKIFKSTNGALQWRELPIALAQGMQVSVIAIDPVTPSTIYAAYSGYSKYNLQTPTTGGVLKSSDGGDSWVPAQGNLPIAGVRALVIDPDTPSRIYVAVEAGIFWSGDAAANWWPLDSGAALAGVSGLAIDRFGSLLRAATSYGVFEFQLRAPPHGPIAADCGGANGPGAVPLREWSSGVGAISSKQDTSATATACGD